MGTFPRFLSPFSVRPSFRRPLPLTAPDDGDNLGPSAGQERSNHEYPQTRRRRTIPSCNGSCRQRRPVARPGPGPGVRPPAVVPRGQVRPVHPLGRLFDDRPRGMGPPDPPDPAQGVSVLRRQFQPRRLQPRRVGRPGPRRGSQVRHHHLQAPRRLRHLRQRRLRLRHHEGQVRQGHPRSALGLDEKGRHPARVLLFHHGLASPRLPAPPGLGEGPDGEGRRLRPLHGLRDKSAQGAGDASTTRRSSGSTGNGSTRTRSSGPSPSARCCSR